MHRCFEISVHMVDHSKIKCFSMINASSVVQMLFS